MDEKYFKEKENELRGELQRFFMYKYDLRPSETKRCVDRAFIIPADFKEESIEE